ncbi:nuclear transport factor 2 family protein [Kribbella monticola]|uniref:nuclear transport factor 2 family protein n=1 Tax=Kribbella monticola TaxID=2185285 RepID=UPI000DD4AF49|nr:nuclear transport factor 2 family protein [Kribbella monticola]
MTVDSEVLAVSAAWDAVLVRNDAEEIAGFMADDWAYIGSAGATAKADIIDWIASGKLAHHTMEIVGAARVTVHGETAVITARKQSTGSWDGVSYAADEWISEVFVLQAGRWRCILSHKCPAEI